MIEALSRLLVPLARLCLVNGITFAAAEDILKRAFVQEAGALQPDMPVHGTVSRISTATGISRREVTRLIKLEAAGRPTKPSLAAEVFARWTTGVSWRDHEGAPCVLNRQGPAPSFEALSQSITRDIHPRSMLEELIRLGLVSHDEDLDLVSLTRSDYVPRSDSRQMLGFLGDNVGDHLNAAVSNVMHDSSRHLEQSVFADELSAESIEALRPLIMAQWQALRDVMVPAISTYIEADQLAGRTQNQRVRIGLYSFTETATNSDKTGSDQTEDPNQNSNPKENSK
ncbi:MAG TPA: DUF6502 family protein [Dongiaceae bacterium]|nr:DUF6502 family protein [Dongiaceae bacterium]